METSLPQHGLVRDSCNFSCYVSPVAVCIKHVAIAKIKHYFHSYMWPSQQLPHLSPAKCACWDSEPNRKWISKGLGQRDKTLIYCSWNWKLKTAGSFWACFLVQWADFIRKSFLGFLGSIWLKGSVWASSALLSSVSRGGCSSAYLLL